MRKNIFKKTILSTLLATTLLGSISLSASQVSSGEVAINGSVKEATQISVTVPTILSFVIDPNEANGNYLTTVSANFINDSTAPVNIDVLGITSLNGTSAKVVAYDKFTDWLNLGSQDTLANIGLGIKFSNTATIWSAAENGTTPSVSVGKFRMNRKSTESADLDVKHGLAWDNAKQLNYKLYLKVSMAND